MRALLIGAAVVLVVAAAIALKDNLGSTSGPARVIDGDSLVVNGTRIRLFGIDAVELSQTCDRGGVRWNCGVEAANALRNAISGRTVTCTPRDRDRYDRVVAICRAGMLDLGAAMVKGGYAVALGGYAADEREAREARRGIWGSNFEPPSAYRSRNPRPDRSFFPPAIGTG